MSLQIYLPLNGNISNNGNNSVNPTAVGGINFDTSIKFGNALWLTEDGQGVSLPGYMTTMGSYSTYTMSAWIYLSSTASNHSTAIISTGDWNYPANQAVFGLYNYNNGYQVLLVPNRSGWSSGITLPNKITLSNWYHLAITYDGSVTKGYVNGTYIGQYAGGGITTTSNSSDVHIGRATYYTGFTLHGWMGDVRIYDNALTDSEISDLYNLSYLGVQVWAPLNGNLINKGSIYQTLTSTGASINNSGKIGKCYSMSGTANNAIKGIYYSNSTNISFCIWVKFNSLSAGTHLIDGRVGDVVGYQPMYIEQNRIQIGNGATAFPDISYNFSTNTWYHIAVCYSADNTKVYINGSLIATNTASKGYNHNGQLNFYIGSRFTGTNPLNGLVNDFRIYDRTLSADEVKDISRGLFMHYRLDNNGFNNFNLEPVANTYTVSSPWTTTSANKDGYFWVTNSAFEGEIGATYTISVQCDGNLASGHNTGGVSPSNRYCTLWLYICNEGKSGWNTGSYDSPVCLTNSNYNHRKVGNTHVWTYTMTGTQKYISLRTNSYSDGNTAVTIKWWNFKVEKGSEYTPYNSYLSEQTKTTVGIHEWPVSYDTTVYTESDGSKWIRLVHHNNPASNGVFSSSDTFATGVYKDSNRWYDAEPALARAQTYEFMVKQKTTSDASEVKYRWIQNVNPLTAVYTDVTKTKVTRITTSGYTDGGLGGIYKYSNTNGNSYTRLAIANDSTSNWFGAFGSWETYQGGIPGYPNTAITSGYMDLYLRINVMGELDRSGMGNDAVLNTVGMSYKGDRPENNSSTYFNGINDCIIIPFDASRWQTDFTMNVWFKKTQLGSKSYETLIGGPSGFEMDTRAGSATTLTLYMASTRGGSITGNGFSSFEFNRWNMVTLVSTSSGESYYVNGKFVKTIDKKSMPSGTYYIGAWASAAQQNYEGLMSDVRIYATPLSAEDVQALYQNSTINY